LWEAALILARWIALNADVFKNKVVLELGAGCGLPSFVSSVIAKKVICTDYLPMVLDNLEYNVELNKKNLNNNLTIHKLDWQSKFEEYGIGEIDIIIGSEITYRLEHPKILINVLNFFLNKNACFYLILAKDREGFTEFQELLKQNNFSCSEITIPAILLTYQDLNGWEELRFFCIKKL